MKKLIELMQNIGFTQYESQVYLALLKQPNVTGYELAKHSGVPASKIYPILNKLVSREIVQAVEEEPKVIEIQVLEPVIEGIDLDADDEEEEIVTIEPMIISAQEIEPELVSAAADSEDSESAAIFEEAIKVVEEEFNQGIRLGAIDLFKKWESLHRKQRIITLKQVPEDIFQFINF